MKTELIKFSIVALIVLLAISLYIVPRVTSISEIEVDDSETNITAAAGDWAMDLSDDSPIDMKLIAEPVAPLIEITGSEDDSLFAIDIRPSVEYVNIQHNGINTISIPIDDECMKGQDQEGLWWYVNIWYCVEFNNMQLGSYYTKEKPWNMQCEDGYKPRFEFQKFYSDSNIGYPPEKPEIIETLQIWCEKDDIEVLLKTPKEIDN